jgi:hypothetical protein
MKQIDFNKQLDGQLRKICGFSRGNFAEFFVQGLTIPQTLERLTKEDPLVDQRLEEYYEDRD